MFSINDNPARLCDGWSRREMMRVGGLSLLGMSLPELLQARESVSAGAPPNDKTFGRAKNIIFLYLTGGPPQHETFDPKPNAPTEIRGPFKPISTNVPGIQFCELLPRTARMADKLAIVRSMSTNDNTHSSSGHWVLTGYKYVGPNARTIQQTDWPYFGSIVKRYKPSDKLPPLSTVWIPDVNRLNENVTPAGQTGGILGRQWDPNVFVGDPSQPDYQVEGLRLTDLPPMRLRNRESLLTQLDNHFEQLHRNDAVKLRDNYRQQAFDLLTSGRAREAFDIEREPAKIRERYGQNRWGQCLVLARRLIEAGVRLVHVQWPREPGDNAVDNPLWDTHAQNADRVEDVLCPKFDVGFSTLIEDLDERGLLDETLVVAIGEFGRTPKINAKGGRDHWGPVFSCALAGAGISGGQVFGSSDKQGGYPKTDRVEPGHLTATMFHLLGINSGGSFVDRQGRPHRLTAHEPIKTILGLDPATERRTKSTGDLARVPVFDPRRIITDTRFDEPVALQAADAPSRPKCWKASPLLAAVDNNFGVRKLGSQVSIGFGMSPGSQPIKISKDSVALLAQEVRSPFAGTYKMSVRLRATGSTREFFDDQFLANFSCKLAFIQYSENQKNPTLHKELASLELKPIYSAAGATDFATFELAKNFENPKPGSNFSFGIGLGVAIIVKKTTGGDFETAAGAGANRSEMIVDQVTLEFIGKGRNEDVKV